MSHTNRYHRKKTRGKNKITSVYEAISWRHSERESVERNRRRLTCYEDFINDYDKMCERFSDQAPHMSEYGYILGTCYQTRKGKLREQEWCEQQRCEVQKLIEVFKKKYADVRFEEKLGNDCNLSRSRLVETKNRIRDDLTRATSKLAIAQRTYEKWDLKEKQETRKQEKKNTKKAQIASALGNSRNLASRIKRSLPTSHPCPYCGNELGDNFHADHIYPVSKGGQSRPENMVNVCVSCNIAKKDLTLNVFIAKFHLDREIVERRLTILGKDF